MLKKAALLFLVASTSAFCANLADVHQKMGKECATCHQNPPVPGAQVESVACLQCHPRNLIQVKSESLGNQNPHKNHLGELECSLCHRGHSASESYCLQCHQHFKHKM